MKTWILSVALMIILTTVLTIILPDGKLNKIIKKSFSFIVVLVVISPVINKQITFDLDFNNGFAQDVVVQEEYLEYVSKLKVDELEKSCANYLKKSGISDIKVLIEYIYNDKGIVIDKVKLDFTDAIAISDEIEPDIIDKIKDYTAEYLNVSSDKIEVYG